MKFNAYLSLLAAALITASCSDTTTLDKDKIAGRWQLSKKEDKNSKTIDLKNSPTVLILDLKKNGYFIYYDSVVNQDWRKTGVPLIQVQSRGQWELKGKEIILTDSDKNTLESLSINSFSDESMVTKSSNDGEKIFTTYGKK